jgi:hypothetical protein
MTGCRGDLVLATSPSRRKLIVRVVPPGLGSYLSSLPRTYVRGYRMPPLRGWSRGGGLFILGHAGLGAFFVAVAADQAEFL